MNWIGFFVTGLAAVMIGWLLWIHVASQKLQGRSVSSLGSVIPELGNHRGRAAVYFYTKNCRPCRQVTPVIDRMREEYDNLYTLDIQAHPRLARELGIRATPTTLLVEDGRILKVFLGPKATGAIKVFLQAAASR